MYSQFLKDKVNSTQFDNRYATSRALHSLV